MFDEWKQDEAHLQATVEESEPVTEVMDEEFAEPETEEAHDVEASEASDVDDPDENAQSLAFSPGESRLSFDEQVIEKIVRLNLANIDGVSPAVPSGLLRFTQKKPVRISLDEDSDVRIDLSVILEYGVSAPEIFQRVRYHISEAIQRYTGLYVADVNVKVVDVLTPDEFTRQQ